MALAALVRPASAAELQDAATGFRMPLDVAGASTCTLLPKRSADPACAQLKPGLLEQALGSEGTLFGAAALVRDGRHVYIRATTVAGRLASAEDIQAHVAGSERRMAALGKVRVYGSKPGTRFDLIQVQGLHAVRFFVDLEIEGPQPVKLRFVEHALPSGGRIVDLSFFAAGDDAGELPLANGLLSGATMDQPKIVGFGEPRSSQVPRAIGAFIGSFVPLVVIALVVLWVILWRRRRQARAGKAAPKVRR